MNECVANPRHSSQPPVAMLSGRDDFFEVLGRVLEDRFHFYRIIRVETIQDVLRHSVVNEPISLAVFDRGMAGLNELRGLTSLRKHLESARVAIASGSTDKRSILQALESGAHGYLLKTDSLAELTRALQLMVGGGIYVPPKLVDLE